MSEQNVSAPVADSQAAPTQPQSAPAPQQSISPQQMQQADAAIDNNPNLSNEQKTEAKAALRKFNVKVDGEEITREIDINNEEEMKKLLQMSIMSQKRAEEAAQLRKQREVIDRDLNAFFSNLAKDPKPILEKLGVDITKFAESVVNKEWEKAQMTEEERKIAELTAELNAIKEKEEIARKEKEEAENLRLQEQYASEYQKDLMSAVEQMGLSDNPEVISRMTRLMKIAVKNKIDLKFQDIAPIVREDIYRDYKSMFSRNPIETIEEILGMDMITTLAKRRRKSIEASKKVVPPSPKDIKETAKPSKTEEKTKPFRTKDSRDFWKKI